MSSIRSRRLIPSIQHVGVVPNESAFFRDDQAAIRAGAVRDGFVYEGEAVTPGFASIREPGLALTILLHLTDGHVAAGDCVEVQYAGAAGRDEPLGIGRDVELVENRVGPALVGRVADDFRGLSQSLRSLELPASVRYGATQALLRACAHTRQRPMVQVVCDQWGLPEPTKLVPMFAQCGDSPRDAADRMILKRVDALPHGLINNVDTRLGRRGELLFDLVVWLRNRILKLVRDDSYRPVLQFDVYGTLGLAFGHLTAITEYLERLAAAADPFPLRIEHPLDAGSREAQIEQLRALRELLAARGCRVELVADEWCNTVDDVEAFAVAGSVDMIQVKTPDLGGLDETVDALLLCCRYGVQAYCGGSCNETIGSAQATAHVALACSADLAVAKPGMGVDEGLSLFRNEMRIALAQIEHQRWRDRNAHSVRDVTV
jgi:methylaspartate ammonia-lyase